jgi:hypothetical protein
MATGTPDSAYHALGERYRDLLARHGVELRVVTTDGDVDNLVRLTDRKSEEERKNRSGPAALF